MTLTKQEKINTLKDRITDFEIERERIQKHVKIHVKLLIFKRKEIAKFDFLIGSYTEQIKEIQKQ